MRNSQVAWQQVADNIVVVTPKTRKIHILSGTGGDIWQSLDQPKNLIQLSEIICSKYEVNLDLADKDIKGFVEELLEKEIVIVC